MQVQASPILQSFYNQDPSYKISSAHPLGFPAASHSQPPAPAAEVLFHRAGRAMHILNLPPPTSLPSPPMSDSSPSRRSPDSHQYPRLVAEAQRRENLPPPPPIIDPRSASSLQGRPLYPGDSLFQYQPGRASNPPPPPPPSYGGVQQLAQQTYPSYGYPTYVSGPQAGVQPSTAIIAPPPLRQNKPARRTKAHVASACVNCKKAHLSCDVQRPCGRCVASGKQESCKDVQHKKRGRPRLRDDKEFGRSEEPRPAPSQLLGTLPAAAGSESFQVLQQPAFPSSHRATDPLRVLKRSARDFDEPTAQVAGGRLSSLGSYGALQPGSGPISPYHGPSLPVAFLNIDLVILKTNQAFQDLVALVGDIRGRNLGELLEARQTDVLQRLRNELRDERDEREPAYMAPITPVPDPVQSVTEQEVDQVSSGFTDRPHLLNFRLPGGQNQFLQTQIRLAKTSLYFVTLVVHTPRTGDPTLLTQQMAPPTPVHFSQTLSAPSSGPPRDHASSSRPPSSASSAPTSPYFNFSSVRTSLPPVAGNTGAYGGSPSYGHSPTAGPDHGYFPTIQPPSQPGAYPSPYPPISRTSSVTSEPSRRPDPFRETARPGRLEGLQLPPIRTAPAPLAPAGSPAGSSQELGDGRFRRRQQSPPPSAERPDTPDTAKRRRLNIREMLE